jgi:hypothetical protein
MVLWVAAVYTLRSVRSRPGNQGVRFYWVTVVMLALALTVLLPPVYLKIDRLLGVPNLARFIGNCLGLVACWTAQRFLAHVSGNAPPLRGLMWHPGWILIGALVLLGTLFAAAPVDQESTEFMKRYGAAPFVLEYRLVLLSYIGLTLVNVAGLSWRYAMIADQPALRLGLRVTSTGGFVGLCYVTQESAYAFSRRLGLNYPLRGTVPGEVLISVAVVLITVGSTMPIWGPRLGIPHFCRWVGNYRSLRRLYPLWWALYSASPDIALMKVTSPLAETLVVRDLGFFLYRRTIEIEDGRLVLRSHFLPRAADLARELCERARIPEADMPPIVEAANLRVALAAKAVGQVGHDTATTLAPLGGSDVASNVAALERVAHHFSRSPIVRTVTAQVVQELLREDQSSLHMEGHGRNDD